MDVFGNAIADFYQNGKADTLWLHNSYDEAEEMPVDIFFRTEEEMSYMELDALDLCNGKILDVGAGVGSHSLELQKRGLDVVAIDISPKAVEIMHNRGVKQVFEQDFFTLKGQYDTLLLLMNGIGLCGTLQAFEGMLAFSKTLLRPGGQILFDSSDISYLYEAEHLPTDHYFGEIDYCYQYKGQKGNWFKWLYIDPKTMREIAQRHNYTCQMINMDDQDQYLARLTLT